MAILGKELSQLMPHEIELLKEAASALARCGENLENSLAQLREAEASLDHFGPDGRKPRVQEERATGGSSAIPAADLCSKSSRAVSAGTEVDLKDSGTESAGRGINLRSHAVQQYRLARDRAEEALYTYLVQREAIGLRTHAFVWNTYPMPPLRKTTN